MSTTMALGELEPTVQTAPVETTTESAVRSLASWLILLAVLVSLLIMWGGIVRLSGSGLSIPEWPIVNGSLLPPFTASDWQAVLATYKSVYPSLTENLSMGDFRVMFSIEYFHRFLAALVGIMLVAIVIRARKQKDAWPLVKKPFLWAVGLLFFQAILGGIVVKFDLQAQFVAVHLGTAFVFFGIILWQAMRLARVGQELHSDVSAARRPGWWATGAVLAQVITGGLVAGTGAGLLLNTWPKIGAYWVPPFHLLWADWFEPMIMNIFQNQVLIQFVHRWLAFVAAAIVVLMMVKTIRRPMTMRGRFAMRAVGTVLVLQILLGIGNLLMKVPFWMAFVHLATGLALYANLLIITHESGYKVDAQTR